MTPLFGSEEATLPNDKELRTFSRSIQIKIKYERLEAQYENTITETSTEEPVESLPSGVVLRIPLMILRVTFTRNGQGQDT